MANGYDSKDANGNIVKILSQSIVHGGLGITGQAQVFLIADGQAGQNFAYVDGTGGLLTSQKIGAGYTLQYGSIDNAGAAGSLALVAPPGGSLRVYLVSYTIVTSNAVTVQFKDSGANALSGAMAFAVNGGTSISGQPHSPQLATGAGLGLNIAIVGAFQVSGHFTYIVNP